MQILLTKYLHDSLKSMNNISIIQYFVNYRIFNAIVYNDKVYDYN